jgi:beta-lactamase regulating signal transducer with metallopeptidase domain
VEFYESGEMSGLDDLLLLSSEAAIVALGAVLVYVSMRAYRRNRSKSMLAMSIGFMVILVGSLIEESIVEILGYQLILAHALENSVVAVGLLILVYSIYGVRE